MCWLDPCIERSTSRRCDAASALCGQSLCTCRVAASRRLICQTRCVSDIQTTPCHVEAFYMLQSNSVAVWFLLVCRLQYVIFGDYMITAWYHSPLPPPFDKAERLYVCPYTLKYFRKRRLLQRHLDALPPDQRHPPGSRVYTSPPAGRQYRLSTAAKPSLTAACDPPVCAPTSSASLASSLFVHALLCLPLPRRRSAAR